MVWMVCPSHFYDNKFVSREEITYFLNNLILKFWINSFLLFTKFEFDKVQWWVMFKILLFDWTFIILLFFLERVFCPIQVTRITVELPGLLGLLRVLLLDFSCKKIYFKAVNWWKLLFDCQEMFSQTHKSQ